MPTRVLLEGPAIEPLLEQVREEYGSGVRIVSADKIRSGGFGGFFAKQHYELSVEIPDATVERPPAPFEEPAHTLEELLERAEAKDRIEHDPPVTATEDAGNAAAFAELLAGLDVADQIASKPPDRPAVRPLRPAPATGPPVNSGGHAPSLAELMGGLGVNQADTTLAFEPVRPGPAPVRSAAAVYGTTPANAPVPPAPPVQGIVPVARSLMAVGLPEAMAARITGNDTYAGVLTALASRPATPAFPGGDGEILVLAGDVAHAVPIGKDLLAQAGIDPAHLLFGGPSAAGTGLHSSRVLHSPEAAAVRAGKLQASDSAWIVVLDAPVGGTDLVWIRDMCEAIGATAVWAVVDATRKTADTARHLHTLGEVEALVVHGVELTGDPATVLGLDLPIYSLDGKPATPHAWAAMLCARIADAAPPPAAPRRPVRSDR